MSHGYVVETDTRERAEARGDITLRFDEGRGSVEWWGLDVEKAAHTIYHRGGVVLTHATDEQRARVNELVAERVRRFGRPARS